MRYYFIFILVVPACCTNGHHYTGNPVIKGWYADPEGLILNNEYRIFPTYSAPYNEQVYLDAFSSKDLVTWEKHGRIIDTSYIKWAWRAMWAPSVIVNTDNTGIAVSLIKRPPVINNIPFVRSRRMNYQVMSCTSRFII
jgi:sucrose-6-phosphate hydrolase SacC (GH32 family)